MKQQLLCGISKEQQAITLLQNHEPSEGYYLAFSGGKDSQVIYDLAVKAKVKFEAYFNMTTVDSNEVREFIKVNYSNVIWVRPKKSMFQIIEEAGTPPTRIMRFCCRLLKEMNGNGRTIITGIRSGESVNRSKRNIFEKSTKRKDTWFLHPIFNWTTTEVWDYIKDNHMEYCSLYDKGKLRIGCIMCPMQGTKEMLKDKEMFPKYYRAYIRAFDRMLKKRELTGKKPFVHGRTGEEVMYWWIHNADIDNDTPQSYLDVSE